MPAAEYKPLEGLKNTFKDAIGTIAVPYIAGELGKTPVLDRITDAGSFVAGFTDPIKSRYHYVFESHDGKFTYIGSSDKLVTDVEQIVHLPEYARNQIITSKDERVNLEQPKVNLAAQYFGAFDSITAGRFKKYDPLARWMAEYVLPGEQLEKYIKHSPKKRLGNSRFYVIDSLHPVNLATNGGYWGLERAPLVYIANKTGLIDLVEKTLEKSNVVPWLAFQQLWGFLSDIDYGLTGIPKVTGREDVIPKMPDELSELDQLKSKYNQIGQILSVSGNPAAAATELSSTGKQIEKLQKDLYGTDM